MHAPHGHLAFLFGFLDLPLFLNGGLFVKSPTLEFLEQTFLIDLAFQGSERLIDLVLVNSDLKDRSLVCSGLGCFRLYRRFGSCAPRLVHFFISSEQIGKFRFLVFPFYQGIHRNDLFQVSRTVIDLDFMHGLSSFEQRFPAKRAKTAGRVLMSNPGPL